MAKQKRKPAAQSTPIIRHPLFPAVVALWFGALFGLGSLAIRPGLIESLVLKTHLDTLIPAAAPPLGVTARICIALALAVLGGLLGAKFSQFITRPKPDAHQRKRGAASINETDLRRRDAHPDAPARAPISAHEELGEDGIDAEPVAATIPGRRRALTVDESEAEFTVPEFAPLPGGAPQVIDLGELDLAGSEVEALEAEPTAASDDALPAVQDFQSVPGQGDGAANRQVFGQPAVTEQVFVPQPEAPATSVQAHEPPPQFVNYGPPVAPPIDFSRPGEVIAAANAARTEQAPLFQRPAAEAVPDETTPVESASVEPATGEPAPAATAITAEAVAEAAAVALDSLGLVELTERFAATLRKRRAALAASTAVVEVDAVAAPAVELPVPQESADFDVPQFEVPPFAVPESASFAQAEPAFAADPVPVAPLEAELAPLAATSVEPAAPAFAPLGEDLAAQPPVAPQPEAPSAPLDMPAALRPISFDELDEDEDFATYLPLRHIPMPQAPAVAEAPAEPVAASAPPAFQPPVPQAYEPEPVPAPKTAGFNPPVEGAEAVEEQVADGYSSLLAITKPEEAPRQTFVRIEEPEPEHAAIEPVVIFPGQAARQNFAQPQVFAPQVPAPAAELQAPSEAPDAASLRRFDAPSSAVAGQAVAAQAPAAAQDPAETERALRAALATLQRMSGAA